MANLDAFLAEDDYEGDARIAGSGYVYNEPFESHFRDKGRGLDRLMAMMRFRARAWTLICRNRSIETDLGYVKPDAAAAAANLSLEERFARTSFRANLTTFHSHLLGTLCHMEDLITDLFDRCDQEYATHTTTKKGGGTWALNQWGMFEGLKQGVPIKFDKLTKIHYLPALPTPRGEPPSYPHQPFALFRIPTMRRRIWKAVKNWLIGSKYYFRAQGVDPKSPEGAGLRRRQIALIHHKYTDMPALDDSVASKNPGPVAVLEKMVEMICSGCYEDDEDLAKEIHPDLRACPCEAGGFCDFLRRHPTEHYEEVKLEKTLPFDAFIEDCVGQNGDLAYYHYEPTNTARPFLGLLYGTTPDWSMCMHASLIDVDRMKKMVRSGQPVNGKFNETFDARHCLRVHFRPDPTAHPSDDSNHPGDTIADDAEFPEPKGFVSVLAKRWTVHREYVKHFQRVTSKADCRSCWRLMTTGKAVATTASSAQPGESFGFQGARVPRRDFGFSSPPSPSGAARSAGLNMVPVASPRREGSPCCPSSGDEDRHVHHRRRRRSSSSSPSLFDDSTDASASGSDSDSDSGDDDDDGDDGPLTTVTMETDDSNGDDGARAVPIKRSHYAGMSTK